MPNDSLQPMAITADKVNYNWKDTTTVYEGNVTFHQGNVYADGSHAIVYYNTLGQITKIILRGSPAHYTTLADFKREPIHASAKTINYWPQLAKMVLIDKAQVMQAENIVTSSYIEYDIIKQKVVAHADKAPHKIVIVIPQ